MSEMKETKTARKDIVIVLGIICIILIAGLGGTIAVYTSMIDDKNNTISSLNTQISELNSSVTNLKRQIASDNTTINSLTSNVTNLKNQLNSILNESSFIGDIVMSDPSAWVNRTVMVEGNVSSFLPPGFWRSPYNYELGSNGTMIGVSWQGEYSLYNEKNVMVLGIVTEGRWNATQIVTVTRETWNETQIVTGGTWNATITFYGPVVYFIEAERIDVI
jgi:cell division protein FtsL